MAAKISLGQNDEKREVNCSGCKIAVNSIPKKLSVPKLAGLWARGCGLFWGAL